MKKRRIFPVFWNNITVFHRIVIVYNSFNYYIKFCRLSKADLHNLNKVRKDHYSNFYVIEGKDKIYKIAVDENGNRYYITKNKNNK